MPIISPKNDQKNLAHIFVFLEKKTFINFKVIHQDETSF